MKKDLLAKVNLLNPYHFLGFGFGSGLIPFMPGTMGSLAAIPLILIMSHFGMIVYLLITLVSILAGIFICDQVTNDLGVHDHGSIVWDEIAGMMIVFIAVPITWYNVLLGFLLFRVFDILKPWPISFFDKHVHSGFGIMLDDLLAGAFALAILHLIVYTNSYFFS